MIEINLQPWQKRLIQEQVELRERLAKLEAFTKGSLFALQTDSRQKKMHHQLSAMRQYDRTLTARISDFAAEEVVAKLAETPDPNELKPGPITLKPPVVGSLGWAIEHLEAGKRVTRCGWNGPGQYLELQMPDPLSKMTLPYVYIRTVQGDLVPWICSQTDLLARDWRVAL